MLMKGLLCSSNWGEKGGVSHGTSVVARSGIVMSFGEDLLHDTAGRLHHCSATGGVAVEQATAPTA